ncbi:MAG: hypothetical protein EBZ45_07715, partial [Actinobacteria bacterium]|nr:hypothetical protein [Actinomycetota bacterium]
EWPEGVERPKRGTINMNRVARVVNGDRNEWPVAPRVLVIQGANPAVTSVDQVAMLEALSREEVFTVLHEQVMTDTAVYADVVLPATSHFEINDVVGSYGSYTAQANNKVIDRVGESKSNGEVAEALALALGFSQEEFDGQLVEVTNSRATIRIPAEVDGAMRAGVCSIPKGLWRRSVAGGLTANAFAPDTYSDLSDGACFNDARVEIRAL